VLTGDQTLWAIGTSDHGHFTGVSNATLSIGSFESFSKTNMQGFVTTAGQIIIVFTSDSASNPPIIGIGQMREWFTKGLSLAGVKPEDVPVELNI